MKGNLICERCRQPIFGDNIPLDGMQFHADCAKAYTKAAVLRISCGNKTVRGEVDSATTWGDIYAANLMAKEVLELSNAPFAALLLPRYEHICGQILPLLAENIS